jgi:hypothetical protein
MMDLIFEKSRSGRTAGSIPVCDVPEVALDQVIDQRLLRQDVDLPEVAEVDLIDPPLHGALAAKFRRGCGVLPAGVLHHEVQSQNQ